MSDLSVCLFVCEFALIEMPTDLKILGPNSLNKIGTVKADIMLIWTKVTRTIVMWTSVTLTADCILFTSQDSPRKLTLKFGQNRVGNN